MIKLIALDIDGTIANRDLQFSPRVKHTITRVLAQGLIVTLATGRGPSPADYFAEQLGLTAPLVTMQGGVIYDHRQRLALHETRLAPAVIPWIALEAQARGWHLHFETTDIVYMPYGLETPSELAALFRVANLTRVKDFLTQMPETPHKFIVSVREPTERDGVQQELTRLVQAAGLPLDVFPSHPILVEALPHGVHKASGLAWLAEHLGIARSEVLAVGDNDNDITMLRWAGVGVAMGSASPGALAAADWVAPALDDDGAVAAIEKYALTA
jgi:Cof subfamily protein (haloacid dehalogenase superfamily)